MFQQTTSSPDLPTKKFESFVTNDSNFFVGRLGLNKYQSPLSFSWTPVASLFLLCTIVVVIVITVFVALFRYCTFIIYSAIRLSYRKCVINSVFSVHCSVFGMLNALFGERGVLSSCTGDGNCGHVRRVHQEERCRTNSLCHTRDTLRSRRY